MELQTWIDNGIAIFPLLPGKKIPATARGFHDASTSLTPWQGDGKNQGVGVPTGEKNGIWVLDIDKKGGGLESWQLLKGDRDIGSTFTVRTQGGGLHFYFLLPDDDSPIPTSAGKAAAGVDVRGDGGYVVAPPTPGYEVIDPSPPGYAPAWLVSLVRETKKERLELEEGEKIPVGAGLRHEYMVQVAQGLADVGLSPEALRAALEAVNHTALEEPVPDSEIDSITRWAALLVPNNPIDIDEDEEEVVKAASELLPATFKFLDDPKALSGLPTGLPGIDRLFGGGKRTGELTLTQAVAKTGKNTLWHSIMMRWLKQGVPIGYACREMIPSTQVMPMLASMYLNRNVYQKPLSDTEKASVREFFSDAPLYFAPGFGAFHWDQFERWIRTLHGLGVQYFFVDHLHYLLKKEDYAEAAEFGRNLKSLINKLDIHVDLIVQPTKLPTDPRTGTYFNPSQQTLRGGANIGQVCDNLINMWRVKQGGVDGHMSNISCLHVELMRSPTGKAGKIHVRYNPDSFGFEEVEFVQEMEEEAPPQHRHSGGYQRRFQSIGSAKERISDSPVGKVVT